MKKVELTSKLLVALIATVVVFSAMTVPSVVAQTTSSPPIRANSVTSGSIKDGEVKTADLADNAVTSNKIKNGEVKAEDIAAGVIPDGVQPTVHEVRVIGSVDAHSTGRADATCPDGEIVTGGGFVSGILNGVTLNFFGSQADLDHNAWVVVAQNPGDLDDSFNAVAVCMDFSP